jgi:PAS domain S-box-containing protein
MTNNLVRQMLTQIESDYSQLITLRTMSATIGRQPAYLGRLFHQEVGASVRDHLTRVRLEHAAELIRDGVKIEAVALCVGYRSKKNFYQRFKRHYGTTPVRYRTGEVEAGPAPQGRITLDTASEPGLSRLAAIVRASNRAWRLAVRAQESMLRHFMDLRMGLLLTNDAGRYVCANRSAASVTGYSMTELCDLSPNDVFVDGPSAETRCVWQLVLWRSPGPKQPPNAMVRTKAGDSVGVYLVTLKNLLWGAREMSAMLERTKPLLAG